MNKLSSSQKSYLRSKAHHLEPVVFIGKKGLTEGTRISINNALEAKELIKLKYLEHKNDKKNISNQIALSEKCHIVGMIGHILILYRQNSDEKLQKYKLPT